MSRYLISMLTAVSLCLLTACDDPRANAQTATPKVTPVSVEALQLESTETQGQLALYGRLEPATSVSVNVDFAAPVAALLVGEGDRVQQGQPLLRLDTTKIALKHDQTLHTLEQAQSLSLNAKQTLLRMKELRSSKTISQQQLDDAEAKFDTALAQVQALQSELALLQRDLANALVISPVDGIISRKRVESGENALAYQPLLDIEVDGSIKVSVFVGENMLPLLRLGNRARIDTVMGSADSHIVSIGANADPTTGNYEVKLLLDNRDHRFKSGMNANVMLQTIAMTGQLILPESALVADDGEHVVFRIENDTAKRQPVQIGLNINEQLHILAGAKAGDTIVMFGAERLIDGSPVRVEVHHE